MFKKQKTFQQEIAKARNKLNVLKIRKEKVKMIEYFLIKIVFKISHKISFKDSFLLIKFNAYTKYHNQSITTKLKRLTPV